MFRTSQACARSLNGDELRIRRSSSMPRAAVAQPTVAHGDRRAAAVDEEQEDYRGFT